MKIVHTAVKLGSQNYRLIEGFVENKAEIVATESPELLIEERNLQIDIYSSSTLEEKDKVIKYDIKGKTLLHERDKYIASRINSTLKTGETGILFIGAEHNIILLGGRYRSC
jgi:hypothetical protein